MADDLDTAERRVTPLRDSSESLPRAQLGAFAVGSLGTGLFSTVPTVLLLFFCTETLGIAAGVASGLLFLPKLWCLFWDPFVGRWSDRTATRWGRRTPFLAVGATGTALAFLALFHAPAWPSGPVTVYVGVAYFLATSFYTLFSVPYIAVPAEISAAPRERERAIAWRMPCMMAGVFLGAAGAPHLVALGGGGRDGYAFMSWTIAAASLTAMLVAASAVRGLADAPAVAPQTGPSPLRHRPFLRLVLAYLMQMSAVAYVLAAVPYLATQVLHAPPEMAGTLLAALLVTSILSMPLWSALSRRLGVQRCLTVATIVLVVTLGGLLTLEQSASRVQVLLVFALLGVPIAALQLLPFMLLAHVVADFSSEHGVRNEGAFTGLFIAAEKVALAAGPMFVGIGLSTMGYVGGTAREVPGISQGILLLAFIVPSVLGVVSAIVGRVRSAPMLK